MSLLFLCYAILIASVLSEIKFPLWSWDTIANISFFMGCNSTGGPEIAFNDKNLDIISRYAIVCIDQCQGENSMDENYYYEQYATAAAKQLKAINPHIHMMYYLNSKLDWPQFELYYKFLNHKNWWLKNISGDIVYTNGDSEWNNSTNLINFDMSQQNGSLFWASDCINATNTKYWDSCNIDQVHCWMPQCYKTMQYNYTFSQYVLNNFNITKYKTMQYIQQQFNETNNGPLYINNQFTIDNVNGFAIENLNINENGINQLLNLQYSSNVETLSVKVHSNNCGNASSDEFVNPLSVFLIGVQKYMYFGCGYKGWINIPASNVWHKEFEYPLGEPKGKAVKKGNIWYRSFAYGTNVTFNVQTNKGYIQWAT